MKFYTHITQSVASTAPYIVYMHQFGDDLYVGYSKDAVNRYDEHRQSAYNDYCNERNSKHHTAIRECTGKFYIIATAKDAEEAKLIEANAYAMYKPSLNTNPLYPDVRVDLKPLEEVLGCTQYISLHSRKNHGYVNPDHTRTMCHAKIVWSRGKKRVQSTGNGDFPAGLFIKCSRSERAKYELGDLVQIEAVQIDRGNLDGGRNPLMPRQ